jgi:hypothetical protein
VIGAAPAGPQDLERLNNRARAIMYTLSHTLIEAEAAIRQPPMYDPTVHWDQGAADIYGNDGRPSRTSPRSPLRPTVNDVQESYARKGSSSTTPTASLAPTTSGPTVRTGLSGAARSSEGSERALDLDRSPRPAERESVRSLAHRTPRHTTLGGVIGASQAIERQQSSQAPIRINPVGGIIGARGLHSPATSPPNGLPPLLGGIAAGPTDRKEKTILQGNRDTTWETLDGVPTVIEPRGSVRHDPGPAIGLNR